MRRYASTLVTLLLLCVVSNAWSQPQAKTPAIEAGEGQFWWNNHDETNPYSDWWRNGLAEVGHYNAATFIPGDLFGREGFKISAVSFLPRYDCLGNFQVWISRKLPEFGSSADLETISLDSKTDGLVYNDFNDVQFSKEYDIPSEGLYVGFSFDGFEKYFPDFNRGIVSSRNDANRDGAFFWNGTGSPEWQKGEGNLLLKLLVRGKRLDYAARALDLGTVYIGKDGSETLSVRVENMGEHPISFIKYALLVDGEVASEGAKDLTISDYMGRGSINLNLKAGDTEGVKRLTVVIKEVNGNPNELADNSASGKMITIVDKPKLFPVIEEYTGTWCGNCPFGMDEVEGALERHGDNIAMIAVHYNDPMQIEAYKPLYSYVKSYPRYRISRRKDNSCSIYKYMMANQIQNVLNSFVTVGTIEATAKWSNRTKTAIDIDTKSTFAYSEDDGQYGVAFVLVEDGMTGTGSSWAQSNYLSGNSTYSDHTFWYNAPSSVSGLEFDHVAVAAWDVKTGIEGSVGKVIVKGQPMAYSYKADIASNSLIQDKSKLRLVALLVDSWSGVIVNGAMVNITEPDPGLSGDVNDDGTVDIADAVCIVNYVVSKPNTTFVVEAADVNGDGDVDIADAVRIVNKIVGKE